jgi:hypothetical protein
VVVRVFRKSSLSFFPWYRNILPEPYLPSQFPVPIHTQEHRDKKKGEESPPKQKQMKRVLFHAPLHHQMPKTSVQ